MKTKTQETEKVAIKSWNGYRTTRGYRIWVMFAYTYGLDLRPGTKSINPWMICVWIITFAFYGYYFVRYFNQLPTGIEGLAQCQFVWFIFSCAVTRVQAIHVSKLQTVALFKYLKMRPASAAPRDRYFYAQIAVWTAYFTFDFISSLFFYIDKFTFQSVFDTFMLSHLTGSWNVFSVVITLVCIGCIKRTFGMFFDHYVEQSKLSVRSLRIVWNECREIKETMADNVSLFPLFWVCNVFVKSFTLGIAHNYGLTPTINFWYFIQETGHVLVMIYFVGWINDISQRRLMKFKRQILESERNLELELLYQEIESSIEIKITGCSMFILDKSFILSFISALISFSVLFIQLVGQPKQ